MTEEILFKEGIQIQKPNRVNIPKELLKNMKLKSGDNIKIYYNPKKKIIILKKK